METFKLLADYGLAVGVMGVMLLWFVKSLQPKIEQNTKSIDDLRQAIVAMTENTSRLYETCDKAFEDNRRTIDILMRHIDKQ